MGRVRCDALRQSAEGSTTESMGTVPKIPTLTLWLRSARPLSSNAPTSLVALLHASTKRENSVTTHQDSNKRVIQHAKSIANPFIFPFFSYFNTTALKLQYHDEQTVCTGIAKRTLFCVLN